ncbi:MULTISPECIES: mechanosensitive ion channel [unclassified Moorena]|uniref:mechanosensitive ion channel n=1 Tax=unclassified Moorena TaxID=2683338 RepID=UPI0013B68304|nr:MULTISPECIES: mechanosensitive ion channel [unclassified Moorena]NEP33640.1 mechanosensitive ion channel [Moorena sp. SIO3B2]NEQ05616.1 mechanosensitive ion channel [Moorena sp. SIO4E2]NEQ13069.1 mechanosensitive ion channel [Moorena sp. SIO3E2]NER87063.1 mechanosensitive ion channel [Moorena sp. SIO3A2]
MNGTWEGIFQIVGVGVQPSAHLVLAQTGVPALDQVLADGGTTLLNVVKSIAILVIGLILAKIAAGITKAVLNRTNIDNNIAQWATGGQPGSEPPPIEQWLSGAVFWIIIVFTVVAVLETLKLDTVSGPLNSFLDTILGFLPSVFGAAILLGIAWLIGTIVKMIVVRTLNALNLDQRLGEQVGDGGTSQFSLAQTIGNALYYLIFLLFLPSVLETLGLQGTLDPVLTMLGEIWGIVPNIGAAIAIGAIGWFIAQLVQRLVTSFLTAAGTNQIGERFGLSSSGGRSLAGIIGTIVYVLILIPVATAALNALQIQAISGPSIAMLSQVTNTIPKLFAAAGILAVFYVIGQFVNDLLTNVLTDLGFNNLFNWLGFSASAPSTTDETTDEIAESDTPQNPLTSRTPSELAGLLVLIGIMIAGIVAATDVLQIPALTDIVGGVGFIGARVLSGLVVLAIGLFLANFAFNLITGSGARQSNILAQVARIAIIAFSLALGLQQMGIAPDIVNLAFGLLLGAIAVAIALAFGLGGRDVAGEQVREWLDSFKK